MKTIDESSKRKNIFSLLVISLIILFSCYAYYNYYIFNSIKVVVKDTAVVEYGSCNYDVKNLVQKVDGKIISIKKDIDTNVVGDQEVIFEVKKENVTKEVPIVVSVVDTKAPEIAIKEDLISIVKGDEYNLNDNILSVTDEIDGDINYLNGATLDDNNYYTFNYDENFDSNEVGNHEVVVTAMDKFGNSSTANFTIEVKAPVIKYQARVFSNVEPNQYGGDIVSIAYSLVGSPYVAGSNGPNGFDCSGFVQYVYSRVGVNVSRSSSTQIYDGVGVSYEDAMPGDILSWGYVDGVPTHSALYVGNGQMVHATNPRQGVIASDVAAWTRGSGTHVISVRRIQ